MLINAGAAQAVVLLDDTAPIHIRPHARAPARMQRVRGRARGRERERERERMSMHKHNTRERAKSCNQLNASCLHQSKDMMHRHARHIGGMHRRQDTRHSSSSSDTPCTPGAGVLVLSFVCSKTRRRAGSALHSICHGGCAGWCRLG